MAKVPEQLSQITVHGVDDKNAQDLARAISVGFVGWLAEHKRTVAFIDNASRVGPPDAIAALTRLSAAPPSLLSTSDVPGNVDIKLEIAGAKFETQGLRHLLASTRQEKGTLALSLLLTPAENNTFNGTASASFSEDSDYGFALPISGSAAVIAQQLAFRYLQAHYAKSDYFYAVLSADDFRIFWEARRKAAEIAVRRTSGPAKDDLATTEARDTLKSIDHLIKRYRKKPDVQKLGAYLAILVEDYISAKEQLDHVAQFAAGEEKRQLVSLIARLNSDIAQTIPSSSIETVAGKSEAALVNQRALVGTGLQRISQRAAANGKPVRVYLLLGPVDKFPQFGDRVSSVGGESGSDREFPRAHTNGVAGLIAALAPTARVKVVPVLDETGTTGEFEIIKGIDAALNEGADVLVIPLTLRAESVAMRRTLEAAVEKGVMAVLPAGNDRKNQSLEGPPVEGVMYVGALERDGKRAEYSNFGSGVTLFAPGSVLTYVTPTTLRESKGTTYAATIVAAAAANIIAVSKERPSPAVVKGLLLAKAKVSDGERVLFLPEEN